MSAIARWSYKAVATVTPYLSIDQWNGKKVYGEPYEIFCAYEVFDEKVTDATGQERVAKHTVYTEDPRPKYMDLVELPDGSKDEVINRTGWGMEMFNDSPDFKLVTG